MKSGDGNFGDMGSRPSKLGGTPNPKKIPEIEDIDVKNISAGRGIEKHWGGGGGGGVKC